MRLSGWGDYHSHLKLREIYCDYQAKHQNVADMKVMEGHGLGIENIHRICI